MRTTDTNKAAAYRQKEYLSKYGRVKPTTAPTTLGRSVGSKQNIKPRE